jgi:hypothetical protein
MLRTLSIIIDLLSFRSVWGRPSDRPIHFSLRSRRRLNRARFISQL